MTPPGRLILRNKIKVLGTFALMILALAVPRVSAAPPKALQGETREPVEVTSDRMRSESKGNKIIFSGHVIATWGELEIRSDILEIYNSDNKEGTNQVIAIGNVRLKKGNRRAKGDRAIYLDKSQKVILTGVPKATAWEDNNMIEGKEMMFLLDEDRFLVKDRVRMKFFPKSGQAGGRGSSRPSPK